MHINLNAAARVLLRPCCAWSVVLALLGTLSFAQSGSARFMPESSLPASPALAAPTPNPPPGPVDVRSGADGAGSSDLAAMEQDTVQLSSKSESLESTTTSEGFEPILPALYLPYDSTADIGWSGGPHIFGRGTGALYDRIPWYLGSGLDFAGVDKATIPNSNPPATYGTNFRVLPIAAGTVVEIHDPTGCTGGLGYGCYVAVRHWAGGAVSMYAHLLEGSSSHLTEGQTVKPNETILGRAGKTPVSAGMPVHLHLELRDGAGEGCQSVDSCWGGPLPWHQTVIGQGPWLDGYRIFSYLTTDWEIATNDSFNYEGSAVRTNWTPMWVKNFPFNDYDTAHPERGVVAVDSMFFCTRPDGRWTCEDNEQSLRTQFAGPGAKFEATAAASTSSTTSEIPPARLVSSQTIGTEPDDLKPEAAWVQPQQSGIEIRDSSLRLEAAVVDTGFGIALVSFNAMWDGVWRQIGAVAEGPYVWDWDVCGEGAPDGYIELGLEVWDRAGNHFVYSRDAGTNYQIYKQFACNDSAQALTGPFDLAADPGATVSYLVSFLNNGQSYWSTDTGYYMRDEDSGETFSLEGTKLRPGYNFQQLFERTAPTNQGTYVHHYRMYRNGVGFGDTIVVTIQVGLLPTCSATAVFQDDFSDSGSGWPITDDSNTSTAYVAGEYQLQNKSSYWWMGSTAPGSYSQYEVAVDARRASNAKGDVGLIFGLDDNWSSFYVLAVGNGNYSLDAYEGGSRINVIPWSPSFYINYDNAWNHLEVRRRQTYIELFANGHSLATVQDTRSISGNRVGLFARSYGETILETRFDNFQVRPCGADPVAAPEGFAVTGTTRNSVTMAWASVSNATGYRIFRWNKQTADFDLITTLGAGATSYTDANSTECGYTYWYQVGAFNGTGESPLSNIVGGTTQPCCFALTVSSVPQSGGTVDVDPPRNCDDGTKYTSGTAVRLTANATANYAFTDWSGDLTGESNPNSIAMGGDRVITANFRPTPSNDNFDQRTIIGSVPSTQNQRIDGASTAADDPILPCISRQGYRSVWFSYTPETAGNLTVSTLGSDFDTVLAIWTGARGMLTNVGCDDDSAGNLNSAVTVTASAGTTYFLESVSYSDVSAGNLQLNVALQPSCYTLSVNANPTNGGVISVSPTPDCVDGTRYTAGSNVRLTAISAPEHLFSSWSGDAVGTGERTQITMEHDRSVTANFAQVPPGLILPNARFVGVLDFPGDQDTYTFSSDSRQWISVRSFGDGVLDPFLTLEDSSGVVLTADDNGAQHDSAAFLSYLLPGFGPYQIITSGAGITAGAYRVGLVRGQTAGIADINHDCIVDASDVSQWLQCWGPPVDGCFDADVNLDGNVDISDETAILNLWGTSCPPPVAVVDLTGTAAWTDTGLSWTHVDPDVTHYQVYKSENPYFTSAQAGSAKLEPDVLAPTIGAKAVFPGSAMWPGVGVPNFYMVQAVNRFGAISTHSNRIGFFSFSLKTGSGTAPGTLTNGGFEEGSTIPTAWSSESWAADRSTFAWDSEQLRSGKKSIKIVSIQENDARWIQTAAVEPGVDYRLSGCIKTENVVHSNEAGDAGANLSLMGGWTRSPGVFDTTDWTCPSLDFNSGSDTQVTIAARLGFYSGTTTGTAWFDDLKLEKLATIDP